MEYRHASLDRGQMRYCCQIHYLLYAVGAEHSESGLANAHDVRMISENRERVCGDRSRRNMEHCRGMLAGELILPSETHSSILSAIGEDGVIG